MKLNLLPTYVSKEKQGKWAVIGAVLLAGAGLGLMFYMTTTSRAAIQVEQERIKAAKPAADQAVAISKQADVVTDQARGLILNMNLADAMNQHSKVYPELYDEVRQFIPGFYRISSLSAVPNGPESVTVTMTGYLETFQEYADLMVALLRIPGATAVSRSGFQLNDPIVPGLIPEDQKGRPVKPGEPRIPDNPMDRLDLQIAQAQSTDFVNTGNFGSTDKPMVRGAMPGQSTVTVAVVIAGKNLMTPDPRGTLSQAAALWGGSPSTTPTPAPTTPTTTGTTGNTAPKTGANTGAPSTAPTGGPNRKDPTKGMDD